MTPEDFGIAPAKLETFWAAMQPTNATIIESIFQGRTRTRRDVVLLNAAPAIVAGGAAKTWKEGIRLAAEVDRLGRRVEEAAKNFEAARLK